VKLTDRRSRLLVLAFDPAFPGGEAANALRVVFRDWISKYPDGYALVKDLESGGPQAQATKYRDGGDVVLQFGKYRGQALRDIPGELSLLDP